MERVGSILRWASRGPSLDGWSPPNWLLAHQVDAARRIAGALAGFRGALLADAVGLGKTYVALAVATRYPRAALIAPAALIPQWLRVSKRLGLEIAVRSDQALSRGRPAPVADLLIVDEAHRFRNAGTRRYHALACRQGSGHLLLLTATPVVNRAADLAALLTLFLSDNALAVLGLTSLAGALESRDFTRIAQAALASVMVARSPAVLSGGSKLPAVSDAGLLTPSPLPTEDLPHVLALLRGLRFPTFADRTAAALLALHLRYRLASSVAACLETLRRHRSYLDRAIEAAMRGEQLSRRDARRLFGAEDEFQLSLDLRADRASAPLDPAALAGERERIDDIMDLLRSRTQSDPKSTRLQEIIASRDQGKTIIFTSAIATARDLARRLGWRRVAVVSGRGAWIASGALPLETALCLFSPISRGGPYPERSAQVATLVATDLASEGLDLQDADALIHYDLPWTPLRLEQRLGRIARLGSAHRRVAVWWFAPPAELETDLALSPRIAGKSRDQLILGAPVSSHVGQARVLGQLFAWREGFAQAAVRSPSDRPLYCVVAGPRAAAFALRWHLGTSVPELIVVEAGEIVVDEQRRGTLIERLLSAPPVSDPPAPEDLQCLERVTRERLRAADREPRDSQTARLSRLVSRRAATAARHRDQNMLSFLDQVLERVNVGLNEGGRRTLQSLFNADPDQVTLRRWLRDYPLISRGPSFVRLQGAIFGNG